MPPVPPAVATSKHTEEEAAQHARLVALVEEAAQLGPAMRAALDHVTATLASARDSIGAAPPPAVTVTQPSAPAQAEPAAPSMYPAPPVADAPAAPEQPAPEEPAPTAPLYPAVEK